MRTFAEHGAIHETARGLCRQTAHLAGDEMFTTLRASTALPNSANAPVARELHQPTAIARERRLQPLNPVFLQARETWRGATVCRAQRSTNMSA